MSTLLTVIGRFLVPLVHAQPAPCAVVPGGCEAKDPFENFGTAIADTFIYIAAGLTVLFIMWGGAQMLFSLGDESKVTSGRNSVISALVGFAIVLASQTILFGVINYTRDAAADDENPILSIMEVVSNLGLSALNLLFVIIMIITGFRMVLARGQAEEFETTKKALVYAVAGAVVVNLARALINVVLSLNL